MHKCMLLLCVLLLFSQEGLNTGWGRLSLDDFLNMTKIRQLYIAAHSYLVYSVLIRWKKMM